MIDYGKLREAHELAEKYYKNTSICNSIRIEYYFDDEPYISYQWHNTREDKIDLYEHIDDLITKLKELAQPEPKYKEAWYLDGRDPKCSKVLNKPGYWACEESDPFSLGHIMFETKSQLIEAQIHYWQSLRELEEPISSTEPRFSDGMCCDYKRFEVTPEKLKSLLREDDGIKLTDVGYECNLPFPGDINMKGSGACKLVVDMQCQHESDSYSYITTHMPQTHSKKCIKCGEFYQ